MQLNGNIQKMQTTLAQNQAQYVLPIGDALLAMNELIGKYLKFDFGGEINCVNCGAKTRKSYSQGFCYQCCQSLARCDLCIMRPETCHHHLGTCRESEWGLNNCFTPHIVYLANSSGIKVGITRKINTPSRWIDQGAIRVLPILEVDTRLKSGIIEDALRVYLADKTNWRKMLKNEVEEVDLIAKKTDVLANIKDLNDKLGAKVIASKIQKINYPVLTYPDQIISLNLDKTPSVSGVLQGIKGQYLLLSTGVLNIRKFGSYYLTVTIK